MNFKIENPINSRDEIRLDEEDFAALTESEKETYLADFDDYDPTADSESDDWVGLLP